MKANLAFDLIIHQVINLLIIFGYCTIDQWHQVTVPLTRPDCSIIRLPYHWPGQPAASFSYRTIRHHLVTVPLTQLAASFGYRTIDPASRRHHSVTVPLTRLAASFGYRTIDPAGGIIRLPYHWPSWRHHSVTVPLTQPAGGIIQLPYYWQYRSSQTIFYSAPCTF